MPRTTAKQRTSRAEHASTSTHSERFDFRFDGAVGTVAHVFTATPSRAYVEIGDGKLTVRFGPWTMTTPLTNIAAVVESGPYDVWKVIGPPRVSLADRGITFATNSERGVCLRFFDPVAGIEPTGRVLHPGMTVTVADPDGLVVALGSEDRAATPSRAASTSPGGRSTTGSPSSSTTRKAR